MFWGNLSDFCDSQLKQSAVINIYFEVNAEALEQLAKDFEHFSICYHWERRPGNVEVALIEFSKSAASHVGLVSSVDLANLEPLELVQIMHGHESCKGNSEIVPEAQWLAAIGGNVVD